MGTRPLRLRRARRHRQTVAAWLLALGIDPVCQAGGHFDVDDAGTLDMESCQYETWVGRSRGGNMEPVTGFHFGPACRAGPFELGLNADRFTQKGEPTSVLLGPQLKWTFLGQAPESSVSAALSASVIGDITNGGRLGGQFVVPVTWLVSRRVQLHANAGVDWNPGDGFRTSRSGLAVEWILHGPVSLIAERGRSFSQWTSRIGARWAIAPLVTLDVSLARISPDGLRAITLGLNREFGMR